MLQQRAHAAAGDWPEQTKQAYVDRCTPEMVSQGASETSARGFCRCLIDAEEIEFGQSEYQQMMSAQPDPNGSSNDKRLYQVYMGCKHFLPQ